MAVSVTVAGVSYTIPEVGDTSWGTQVTAWIEAISAVTLQTGGGNFTLTSDLNFGGSFGLISKYYTSRSVNAAAAGILRLANLDSISWRNAANSADLGIDLDASNIFQFGSAINSAGNISGANLSGSNSGDITLGSFGSTPAANGASLAAQVLTLQPADGTHPGSVSTAAQTFAGTKTFSAIVSTFFQSATSNAAASGSLRFANADAIAFRNIGNSADILLQPDADGILKYNSIDLVNLSATQTLTGKTLAAGSNTITGLTNTNLSGSAAITGANVAAATIANSNLAVMAANTVKANVTGSSVSPTDVSLVSAATASAAMIRDSNANVQVNNLIENLTSTATAGGTTTLSVSSSAVQQFTGSLNQTVTLPDCTTLAVGFAFYITNRSTGTVTVNNKGAVAQQTMAANTSAMFVCTSIGSANGAWDVQYVAGSSLSNPMTTGGDMIYGGTSGTPARLANGSANQVVTSAGGTAAPIWQFPAFNIQSKSTTYSAVANDHVIASGASFTITLPTAVGCSGQRIIIQHNGTSLTQIYTLNTTSAQTIGGIASGSYALYTNGEALILVSDGSNWQILSHKTDTVWTDGGPITITGVTTNPTKGTTTSDHFWYRRVGQNLEGRIEFKQTGAGTAGSGDYLYLLPGGVVADTTKITGNTTPYGSGSVPFLESNIGTSWTALLSVVGAGPVSLYDSTHVRLVVLNSAGGAGSTGSAFFPLSTVTLSYSAFLSVPISGWQP